MGHVRLDAVFYFLGLFQNLSEISSHPAFASFNSSNTFLVLSWVPPKLGVYLGGGPGCRSEGARATGAQSYQHLVISSQNTFQSSLPQRWGQESSSIDCLPPLVKCQLQRVGVGRPEGPPCQSEDLQPVLGVSCGQHEGLEACMQGPPRMVQSEGRQAPVSWASRRACLPFGLICSLTFSGLWSCPHPTHTSADPLLHNNVLA